MSNFKIMPIIMSGGAGSRLWPASRAAHPKQLLRLITDKTMVQETALRVTGALYTPPVFICNGAHAAAINEQMGEIDTPPLAIITEPMGRNTAPAAIVAAQFAKRHADDTLALLLPADHHVTKPEAFRAAVASAVPAALSGHLVTFGIAPDAPETGYGYIERGEAVDESAFAVSAFREKPDAATAAEYLQSGRYDWNAGIFLFSPKAFLAEINAFEPEMLAAATAALDAASVSAHQYDLDAAIFQTCPAESIDYAVMEKTDKAAVVPCEIGWNDIGSFKALHEATKNDNGNAVDEGTILVKSENCIVQSDGPVVSVVGLSNVGVIVKDGAVMVVNLDASQDVKKVVDNLKSSERRSLL